MTVSQLLAEANQIMNRNGFSYDQKWAALVWAAINRDCPKCEVKPLERCLNMSDLKRVAREHAKYTKFPHPERVDWRRLIDTLAEKGYQ